MERKPQNLQLKSIYSEKATKFCEISTVDLSYVSVVPDLVEISQKFVAFSEYLNFTHSHCLGMNDFVNFFFFFSFFA